MENNKIPELYWFAVHVKSRHEFKVFQRLSGVGVEAYLPSVGKLNRWKDRTKLVQFPLFPCYLFVHISKNNQDRLTVLKTQGVVKFIGSVPGEPEQIPDEQIYSLKKVVDNNLSLDPYPYLQEGQRVRISKGPLAGVEGILVEKSGQHKLVLSVDILCQSTSVSIQAADVEKI